MSLLGVSYTNTKIFRIGETNIPEIDVPDIYRTVSIVIEPLNIPLYVEADPVRVRWSSEDFDGEQPIEKHQEPIEQLPIKLSRQYLAEASTGTVSITLRPIGSLRYFEVDQGTIDLTSLHFITTEVNVQGLKLNFDSIEGCTHIAVTVSGNRY